MAVSAEMTRPYHELVMPRILVAEDEVRLASFVSRALVDEGLRVDVAPDGPTALRLADTGDYELVVLDLRLPGLDGVDVLRNTIENHPDQRVLILSALSDVETKVTCLDLGATDYLCKPFAISELIARVRARLRQPTTPSTERFVRVGDVALDVVKRLADSGRGPVPLSDREFALLQKLMTEEGGTCSRSDLLREVWGMDFDTGSNVVDVTVGRLRSKLGDQVVETVRHVGYRLRVA
jgi:two-component system copper resistance phosphate regulon response regulator CusR